MKNFKAFFALVFWVCATFSCQSKSLPAQLRVLRLMSLNPIQTLDPIYAKDFYSIRELGTPFENLYHFDYQKLPVRLKPQLALAFPQLSPDRKTYRFHIKEGVFFHDDPCFIASGGKGRELVAEDIVYLFKRNADPFLKSSGWPLLKSRIVGINKWHDESLKNGRTNYSKPISGLRALSRYELEIELTRPNESFLHHLTLPFAAVIPREAVEYYKGQLAKHPVGTGAYILEQHPSRKKLVWLLNRRYHATLPVLSPQRIEVETIEDDHERWRKFISGALDIIPVPKNHFEEAITPARQLHSSLKDRGMHLLSYSALDTTHVSFNLEHPVLGSNKKLRQAMSLAYNIEPVIDRFYKGWAMPAYGPIPPGISGYEASSHNPYRKYNISMAKKMLSDAGYPGGAGLPEFKFYTDDSSSGVQFAKYFQGSMERIGVSIVIETMSWSQLLKAIEEKKADFFSYSWTADYPDGENFMQLFYSAHASPGPNESNYRNPAFDELYQKLLISPINQRQPLYRQMNQILVEDSPWIFGVHRIRYWLTQSRLKNPPTADIESSWRKNLELEQ